MPGPGQSNVNPIGALQQFRNYLTSAILAYSLAAYLQETNRAITLFERAGVPNQGNDYDLGLLSLKGVHGSKTNLQNELESSIFRSPKRYKRVWQLGPARILPHRLRDPCVPASLRHVRPY